MYVECVDVSGFDRRFEFRKFEKKKEGWKGTKSACSFLRKQKSTPETLQAFVTSNSVRGPCWICKPAPSSAIDATTARISIAASHTRRAAVDGVPQQGLTRLAGQLGSLKRGGRSLREEGARSYDHDVIPQLRRGAGNKTLDP